MRLVTAVLIVWFATNVLATQSTKFEVVSIKAQPELRVRGSRVSRSGSRFYEPGTTMSSVVEFAYDLAPFRVVGGPSWVRSDLWEIDARPAAPARIDEMRAMAAQLLGDEFGLKAHRESREMPVYELHLSGDDRRLGPRAKPSTLDCAPDIEPPVVTRK